MLIGRETLNAIAQGRVTLQFRRWRRRTVKPGGTLRTALGVLEIGDIERVEDADLNDADARRAGFADADALRAWIDTSRPGTLERIEIRFAGADPRIALREEFDLSEAELAAIAARLDRMDARADGPWTVATLEAIAQNPATAAQALADALGQDKQTFKTRVRRLKALGLTESLGTGYRLSPRGETVRDFLKKI